MNKKHTILEAVVRTIINDFYFKEYNKEWKTSEHFLLDLVDLLGQYLAWKNRGLKNG